MKLFFDLFPVALFYATFQYARANAELAAAKATAWFGFIVSGGVVGPKEAPTILATVVVVLAIAAQIAWLLARRKPVSAILWVSLAAAAVFGEATVWFHDPAFIKWKFSLVYWLMGISFWVSAQFFGKNLIKALMAESLALPDTGWRSLNLAWIAFFLFMGALNLLVAYNFSENVWFNFKMFGSMGLMLLFVLGQGLYLSRYLKQEATDNQGQA
ncbi:MAG: septation protein A [Candidatus Dactylopiibacterium carminicum]|uniref:Inner membrane-spanning protein YciB n=1 Tax=Candidatus Dactylopiibacterium carminicum TaxID=857335 RepID=A0A272EUQ8_9RHOO|nr:septation protein A [Candidatus Dactylopiibacterium carminicum]KAF7600331.1 septation protein A [Candidatus Dactylopiibacterium carminicum]PAS93841.1 MAG: septation protein A [Candidatus Dactylopiibacterium carminicum]PAS95634.1 MAG: septation protein A [Candidatus Dactylopiibacterium carminicum]PAT00334.1 MAG: septation protein A [Candidatus Dactylopiibacterium carminicum]